jgi:hypothetical protein
MLREHKSYSLGEIGSMLIVVFHPPCIKVWFNGLETVCKLSQLIPLLVSLEADEWNFEGMECFSRKIYEGYIIKVFKDGQRPIQAVVSQSFN